MEFRSKNWGKALTGKFRIRNLGVSLYIVPLSFEILLCYTFFPDNRLFSRACSLYSPEPIKSGNYRLHKRDKDEEVNIKALRARSRRQIVSRLGNRLIRDLIEDFDLSLAETGRQMVFFLCFLISCCQGIKP